MGLRIYAGRAGSGKSEQVQKEAVCFEGADSCALRVLIVPEQLSFASEKALAEKAEGTLIPPEALDTLHVLSFRRLAHFVLQRTGGGSGKRLQNVTRNLFVARVLDKSREELTALRRAASLEGFTQKAAELLSEFKRYNVTPERLLETAELSKVRFSGLSDKLSDFARVYSGYEAQLSGKYIDMDDMLTRAADALWETPLFKGARVWIDGFFGFTPQELRLISELLREGAEVTVTLPSDRLSSEPLLPGDPFFSVNESYRKLLKVNESLKNEAPDAYLGEVLVTRFSENYRAQTPALKHLEAALSSGSSLPYDGDMEGISLFAANNPYGEAEAAAGDILRLVRDKGFRFRDIHVACGDLSAYEHILRAVFNQCGIPFYMDTMASVTAHPLMVHLLGMPEIFKQSWSYRAVFRYAKAGFTGLSEAELWRLENEVLARGIRGSRWEDDAFWENSENKSARDKLTAPIMRFRARTKGKTAVGEFVEALLDFLKETHVKEQAESRAEELRTLGLMQEADEMLQVYDVMLDMLSQTAAAMGEEKMGVSRLIELLSSAAEAYTVGTIPPTADSVAIGDAQRSLHMGAKAIYVLGMNEGAFPKASAGEGIITDEERRTLRSFGLELAEDTRSRVFESEFLIYQVLAAPSEYLYASYAISGMDGRAKREAPVIRRMKKMFPSLTVATNVQVPGEEEDAMRLIGPPAYTFLYLCRAFQASWKRGKIAPIWYTVRSWYEQDEDWAAHCRRAGLGKGYQNPFEPLTSEQARKLYGAKEGSISRIETFSACPFRYFSDYGLKLQERAVYEVKSADTGSLMHAVMERFSNLLPEMGLSWRTLQKEQIAPLLTPLITEEAAYRAGGIFDSSSRYRAMTRRLLKLLTQVIWSTAEQIKKGSFDPVAYELSFGEKGELPSYTAKKDAALRFRGVVDRLDIWETEESVFLRVMDYKSGNRAFHLNETYYGLSVQLPTYLGAVLQNGEKLFGNKTLRPAGMCYVHLNDPLVEVRSIGDREGLSKKQMAGHGMKGLFLGEPEVLEAMDSSLKESGKSDILPVSYLKGGGFTAHSSVAGAKELQALMDHVRGEISSKGEKMLGGEVRAYPYRLGDKTGCDYCPYHAVCRFDVSLGDKPNLLSKKSATEIWETLLEE